MEDGLKTKINQKDEELKKMKQEFKRYCKGICLMNEDNKNPLIKKTDAIAKFDPRKSKGLILRGFKETEYKVVLVVEDNYHINNLVCEEINKNFGYKIKTIPFYDGKPAFAYLKENLNKVDLISSDILLPHLDGIKLLRLCKELCPRIPFIFILVMIIEMILLSGQLMRI